MNDQILRLLAHAASVAFTEPELLKRLRLPNSRLPELRESLLQLERLGRITLVKGNRYVLSSEADLVPGRIRMTRQGRGFLIPDDSQLKEIAIPESATGTALHEDRVLVRRDVSLKDARNHVDGPSTGCVIRILERYRTQIVGTLQRSQRFLYVIPDDPRIPHDIYVPEPRDVGGPAHVGDKVVVELREWESRHTNPEGEIIEVLGALDEEGVDMLSVLRQYHLPLSFPPEVLEQARVNGSEVREGELEGREDCREHLVVTIDPDDAKDFDDAICLQRAAADRWKLWVHIADVSHYVKPGTALDVEARKRGNSTYLVDRVIPMLPEALSNELCSLKPHVERLTKCVEFLLSKEGRVLKTSFYPAVIHSKRRFTYREAMEILQRSPTNDIEQMLHQAHELAQRIRRLRFKAGSLELDFPEMKIRLDERGRVSRIERMENDVSHQLIEEYMLLANEAVASKLIHQKRAAIHRVHEEPDPKRLQEFREDVVSHGIACGDLRERSDVQELLHLLGTIPIGAALKIGFLKSMMRARYAVDPLGHYGLAKPHYAHFTSPIRRYADLVVHRALFDEKPASKRLLEEAADHISMTERNSADAERDSKDVKLYAYLRSQLESAEPTVYGALVTDIRNFGFFVDVPDLAMGGLVPVSLMTDDFYVFDPMRRQLVGRRTRRVIRLGDRLEIQVAKVDSFKKQVDFRLAPVLRVAASHSPVAGRKPQPHAPPRYPMRSDSNSSYWQKLERRSPSAARSSRPEPRQSHASMTDRSKKPSSDKRAPAREKASGLGVGTPKAGMLFASSSIHRSGGSSRGKSDRPALKTGIKRPGQRKK